MTDLSERFPFPPETAGSDSLPVLILHEDRESYIRALRMLANTFYGQPEAATLRPLPWRFDELTSESWGRRALADAERAQIVIVAASATGPLSEDTRRWIAEALALRRGQSTAVVALGEGDDAADTPCRSHVRQIAIAAGLDFIEGDWPLLTTGR